MDTLQKGSTSITSLLMTQTNNAVFKGRTADVCIRGARHTLAAAVGIHLAPTYRGKWN